MFNLGISDERVGKEQKTQPNVVPESNRYFLDVYNVNQFSLIML